MNILDCTLRDGGYYTNWDFDKELVKTYLESMNQLPINYIEVGYRSKPKLGYLGEYFYCPQYVLEEIRDISKKKLVIILNEKDINFSSLPELLKPIVGIVDMVRMAIDPINLNRAIGIAKAIKNMGFEVGFNVMYMSNWIANKNFLNQLSEVNDIATYFYMVDSYGGVYPDDVKEITNIVKSKTNAKIGFHGHNNLELGLINTLTAIDSGADIVDCTITGMGRGAGNLKTELLLTALNAKKGLEVNFNALSNIVEEFSKLEKKYQWGTNLPYMVSGANSLPQKEVMDWMSKRLYSLNSIIRALVNKNNGVQDNLKLEILNRDKVRITNNTEIFIVGGGPSVKCHQRGIIQYIKQKDAIILYASSRNVGVFNEVDLPKIHCLSGNEGLRLEEIYGDYINISNSIALLPCYPRNMGTYIPDKLKVRSYELTENFFGDEYSDSNTAIILSVAIQFNIKNLYAIGFDGYEGIIGTKEMELFEENEAIFKKYIKKFKTNIFSLTPTKYKSLKQISLYEKL